jgi:hypothetical protein
MDHIGPPSHVGVEVALAQGRATLFSKRNGRKTEFRFGPCATDERDGVRSLAQRRSQLDLIAEGALHLLQRKFGACGGGTDDAQPLKRYWPLPPSLTLDGDVLRAGDRILGRHAAKDRQWHYAPEHLTEIRLLLTPMNRSRLRPVDEWFVQTLDAPAPLDSAKPASPPAHDRVYVLQLSGELPPSVKMKDLSRTRVLQMDDQQNQRWVPTPRVAPWSGSAPPNARLVMIAGSRVDEESGELRVCGRTPTELAATAVHAMALFSQKEGLSSPLVPSHISLVTCYLDNGAFAPFGEPFLREAAGPTGFNHPALTVSVRTNSVELTGSGQKQVLGTGDTPRHRQPGGTLALSLAGDRVQATPRYLEDGSSFILDREQDPSGLLAWWSSRPTGTPSGTSPNTSAKGDPFLMGEVEVSPALLARMGLHQQATGTPLPDRTLADRPGAFLSLRFDARRLMTFLQGKASPLEIVQALRLLTQCMRAGASPADLVVGNGQATDAAIAVLMAIRRAVDDDLMLPSSVWSALWPPGEAPPVPLSPDSVPTSGNPDVVGCFNEIHRRHVIQHVTRMQERKRQAREAMAVVKAPGEADAAPSDKASRPPPTEAGESPA